MPTSPADGWPTIEALEAQERDLVLPLADLDALRRLGRQMADAGAERDLPITIQIRSGDRLVFVAALTGSTASNDLWAARKARLSQHFERSSLLVRALNERDGQDVHVRHSLSPELYQAHGGAFPLRVAAAGMIGTVVVSGLPQVEDHAFVVEQLERFVASG
jgi:uncharacterized protein (UPF0303 family)